MVETLGTCTLDRVYTAACHPALRDAVRYSLGYDAQTIDFQCKWGAKDDAVLADETVAWVMEANNIPPRFRAALLNACEAQLELGSMGA